MSIIFLGRPELKLVQKCIHGNAHEISTSNFAYRSFKFWGTRLPGFQHSGPMADFPQPPFIQSSRVYEIIRKKTYFHLLYLLVGLLLKDNFLGIQTAYVELVNR